MSQHRVGEWHFNDREFLVLQTLANLHDMSPKEYISHLQFDPKETIKAVTINPLARGCRRV
ncbi:MAG: hypothetical protein J6P84_02025 [Alphaproteobacteria bacterium]|nr:hypothetical protein [Alphaproteobacteria bacterium]